MYLKFALATLALSGLLGGCETCREHRVACAVAAVVVTGAVVAFAEHQADRHNPNDHDADDSALGHAFPVYALPQH